jgi:hypothetical protein
MAGGWLTQREVDNKRAEVSKRMWDNEYELGEPSIEGRAIDTDAVDAAFSTELGEFDDAGQTETDVRTEMPIPEKGAMYSTGIDWAKKQDWTSIATFRLPEGNRKTRLVSYRRFNRQPWPAMVSKADEVIAIYGTTGAHDATGIGDVVGDYMEGYLEPYTFSRTDKRVLLNEYIAAIENGEIELPRIASLYAEHRYLTVEMVDGQDHTPDGVIACALAWRHAFPGYLLS